MWTVPNIITLVRICFTPVIALLPFIEGYWPKLIAFVIFLAAAISDVWDGHLARSRNEVSDLGKLSALAGVRQFPIRVKCASLAWHTLRAALDARDEVVSTE